MWLKFKTWGSTVVVPTDGSPSSLEPGLLKYPAILPLLGTGYLGAAVGHRMVADTELVAVAR